MKKIKGKNTKPELILRSQLFKQGFRFRIHRKDLPGRPDITLPKYKTIIFVHGCFWHQHKGCNEGRVPSTRTEYWEDKLNKNIYRDLVNVKSLKEQGWNVMVVWECEIEKHLHETITKVINGIIDHED